MTDGYAELQTLSNFSFLEGGSHGEELVEQAKALGLAALGLADRNTLAGVVRAHVAAKAAGLHLIVGARLDLMNGISLLLYPEDRAAYGRLSTLLTLGKGRAEKGACHLWLEDVYKYAEGQVVIALPPPEDAAFEAPLAELCRRLPEPPYLAASYLHKGGDRARLARLAGLAARTGAKLLATNDVLYHAPARRPLADVLACIREGVKITEAGFLLEGNAERHLKSPAEMARLFKGHEEALSRTLEIAGRCRFSLDELKYEYPDEPVPAGKTPQQHLEDLTWEGAAARYPAGVPEKVTGLLQTELALIAKLDYAPYFLTVHDIVAFARRENILAQGRGSAANSAVCYCLGITAVDPAEMDLLFDRFISEKRGEPPDIDVDFEHERREEVIQYIYRRYGRMRAGIAATVISYRARSAVREVGKAMGLTEDVTGALAGTVWGSWTDHMPDERVKEAGLDPADPYLRRTLDLARELMGFPRHLSQHVGGFVLTRGPLCETVPIGNAAMEDRTFVEWDKDDLDELGLMKVDVLGLGMLTCIRKCFGILETQYGRKLTLADVPGDDAAVYDMICKADTIGVFQIESRAQMSMLPRLRPRTFYDLVIEVAIVRPGPIQGDMVHPYLRRRQKLEDVRIEGPSAAHGDPEELRRILNRTLGVPLFQEQAMKIAIVAAEFTGDEANQLRHAMATFRRRGNIDKLRGRFVGRMIERGYPPDFAERCFKQIEGFGEYGFPESHAASFAKLVYVSAWLKHHYPAAFAAALLNAQPMGFYAPAQIVSCAKDHGVEVRPADVCFSDWDNTLEPAERGYALRLGLRQVDGFAGEAGESLMAARAAAPFRDMRDLKDRAGISALALEKLAAADAFRALGRDRREALWEARALKREKPLPLFAHAGAAEEGEQGQEEETARAALPAMPLAEHVVADYQTLRLSLKAHPVSFLRDSFRAQGVFSAAEAKAAKDGARLCAAGVVLIRQRPGGGKAIFVTLEDETGAVNCVIWASTFERYRRAVMSARILYVKGRLQSHQGVIHLVAEHIEDWSAMLGTLMAGPAQDETKRTAPERGARHPRNVRVIPKSRDFH
ncbi:error-prone DNA polymerase [Tepidicaulis sp. LMO-SS28]|uniref:error-prone DNA polymerase n=1 Tax=Tepidicaulis sp. LMO-SS28 TaxID=3447455 RepID=UPI003EE17A14